MGCTVGRWYACPLTHNLKCDTEMFTPSRNHVLYQQNRASSNRQPVKHRMFGPASGNNVYFMGDLCPAFANDRPIDTNRTRDLFGRPLQQEPVNTHKMLFSPSKAVQEPNPGPTRTSLFSAPCPFADIPFKEKPSNEIKKEEETIVCDCNPYYETGLFGDKTKHDAYEQGYIDGYRRGFNAARGQR